MNLSFFPHEFFVKHFLSSLFPPLLLLLNCYFSFLPSHLNNTGLINYFIIRYSLHLIQFSSVQLFNLVLFRLFSHPHHLILKIFLFASKLVSIGNSTNCKLDHIAKQ